MTNANGSVVVNGITDSELAEILEIKAKNISQGQFFNFNPQALQQSGQNTYNNAVFSWNGEQGFQVVQEIVNFLFTGKKARAQGQ